MTTAEGIAAALERVRAVIHSRPGVAVRADTPALAVWEGGLRVLCVHPAGAQVATDLPRELGGAGQAPTPGWLLRSALAACAAASIALQAAARGITLARLEVQADSVSDARGLLGIAAEDGAPVSAAPAQVQLRVRIAAPGVEPAQLRMLVEEAESCSPVSAGLRQALPVSLHIDIGG